MGEQIDIRSFGAAAGEERLCTREIQAAIDACPPGGTVVIPEGCFCTGALFLHSDMTFYLKEGALLLGSGEPADYPVIEGQFEGRQQKMYAALINAVAEGHPGYVKGQGRLHDITLTGAGKVDANGKILFEEEKREAKGARGRALYLANIDRLTIQDITVRQSPAWCVHMVYCSDVTVEHVKIYTKWDENGNSYGIINGDGMDVDSCSYVEIRNCLISSQDDCIALKSGRDEEGRKAGIPTEYVNISGCEFKSGFGVALGSESSGGIRNVRVENCKFENVYSVGSIKAPRGRGNRIENVLFRNHTLANFSTEHSDCKWFRGAINVDMFYSHEDCEFEAACPVGEGTPVFSDIVFRDITLETIAGNAIYLAGLPESPLRNVSLINIKAKGKQGLRLYNVGNLIMENVEV